MFTQTKSLTPEQIFEDYKWRNPQWRRDSVSFRSAGKESIIVRLCCGAEILYDYRTKETRFRAPNGDAFY